MIKSGREWDLSEQQVMDCVRSSTDRLYYSNGCGGGWPSNALDYAYRWNITTEAKYNSL